jgi:predicted amidohydrolase
MHITIAQFKVTRDYDDNMERALNIINSVETDVLVFPELFNTGYYVENFEKCDITPILNASKGTKTLLIFGMPEKAGKNYYNSAFLIYRGKVIGKHRKTKLFPLLKEDRIFKAGKSVDVFKTHLGVFGVLICYELRFPEIARELAKKGAEVLFVIAQFPLERIEHWRILLKARAIENQLFVVGVNCVNSLCGGHSAVIDPWGKTLIEGSDDSCTISVEIDTSLVAEIRERYPFLDSEYLKL